MTITTLILIVGSALGGLIQGMSGFAFGMVAMSIWVWSMDPREAAVMAVFGGLAGQVLSALTVRRTSVTPPLFPFIAGGLIGVPIGALALPHIDAGPFRLILGAALALGCPLMLAASRLPRIVSGGRVADSLAGITGGIIGGVSGLAGLAPAIWSSFRGYDKNSQRALIQNFNLTILFATMLAYVLSGTVSRQMLPRLAIVVPALIIPSVLGARIYTGMSEVSFRRLVLVLLTLAGAVMIASSLLRHFT